MDLLYSHERYDQALHVFDTFNEKQSELGGEKYPYSCCTLAIAACHKLVSLTCGLTSQFC